MNSPGWCGPECSRPPPYTVNGFPFQTGLKAYLLLSLRVSVSSMYEWISEDAGLDSLFAIDAFVF